MREVHNDHESSDNDDMLAPTPLPTATVLAAESAQGRKHRDSLESYNLCHESIQAYEISTVHSLGRGP